MDAEEKDPFFFGDEAEETEEVEQAEKVEQAEQVDAGVDKPQALADTGLLIDMRSVVKTYNVGEPSELTVLHGVDFMPSSESSSPLSAPPVVVNRR